jgi:hypothetical protein
VENAAIADNSCGLIGQNPIQSSLDSPVIDSPYPIVNPRRHKNPAMPANKTHINYNHQLSARDNFN